MKKYIAFVMLVGLVICSVASQENGDIALNNFAAVANEWWTFNKRDIKDGFDQNNEIKNFISILIKIVPYGIDGSKKQEIVDAWENMTPNQQMEWERKNEYSAHVLHGILDYPGGVRSFAPIDYSEKMWIDNIYLHLSKKQFYVFCENLIEAIKNAGFDIETTSILIQKGNYYY